jgi:nicotinate-nucleotide adenylyltransferase
MKEKERIGVFGGTYDPVHLGHLMIAEDLREAFGLSRVIFVPAHVPPHKAGKKITSGARRLAMLKSAVRGRKGLCVSDIELKRGGKSYTIDTIRRLKKEKDADYYFFAGSDAISFLPNWKEIDALVRECEFVLMVRPGHALDDLSIAARRLSPETLGCLERNFVIVRQVDISSTEIRERVRDGMEFSHLVPPAVARRIRESRLYR